jgi:chromosome segregation ATPase
MSTPGKVLVVLVTLASLIWIVMVAAVADINTTGSEKVATLNTQVEKLQTDVVETQRQLEALKDQIGQTQVEMGLDLATVRSRQAALEKVRSDTLEMASRVKLQLADYEASIKTAETARDQREAEKKAEVDAKARAEAEVKQLASEHSRLTEQLTKLTQQFRTTLESNKRLIDRLLKSDGRQARSASFVR